MMVAAAVVAACLSFAARADRLRVVAREQVHQSSARLVRGHGKATAEDWREYQRAQDELLKADFLESFGIVVAILVPVMVVVLTLRSRRPGIRPATTEPGLVSQAAPNPPFRDPGP
jgi:hypothetical protein